VNCTTTHISFAAERQKTAVAVLLERRLNIRNID